MSGDDLSIRLFVAATAIALLSVAVSQAGIKQRGFIWTTALVGLVLGVCAIFWQSFTTYFPNFQRAATDLGSNPWSWFALLLFGIVLVNGTDVALRAGWIGRSRTLALNTQDVPVLAPTPTSIEIVFRGPEALPESNTNANVARWYVFKNLIVLRNAENAEEHHVINTFVFLVFDHPIPLSQVRFEGIGSALPRHEVKDSSPRHAIALFEGALNWLTLRVVVAN